MADMHELHVEGKHDVLLRALSRFYDDDAMFTKFRQVVLGEARMSLRVLDWLVTNVAKKTNIVYALTCNGEAIAFNMYLEYKSQLKAYSKRYFDPFCRRGRITFRGVSTTCGQLNFFRWALLKGVLDYALCHHDDIEADMLASIEHRNARVQEPRNNKRKELSKAAIKTCTTTMVKVKVKFS